MSKAQAIAAAERIAAALGGRSNGKGGYRCLCPAHDDRHHPNFDVDLGANGKLLVNCTAGCTQTEVIEALRGLDLWPGSKPLTEAEKQQAAEATARRKEMKRQEQERAARQALEIYQAATGDPKTHPYTQAKGGLDFGPHVRRGAWPQRGWTDALIVPLYNAQGQITTLQAINSNLKDKKDFLRGGRKRGSFYPFGRFKDATGQVWIAEGLADTAAVHAVSGAPCVMAVDAGNLSVVAEVVREIAPEAEICIMADDDAEEGKEGNPGIEAAIKAVRLVHGKVAAPNMGKKADAWDVWKEYSRDGLLALLQAARPADELVSEKLTAEDTHNASTLDTDLDAAREAAEQAAFDREVERLASLPVHMYERQRKEAAKALGIRAGILDTLIQNARKGEALASELPFDTVTPWPEQVQLEQLLNDIASTIRRFIVCTQEVANTVALWAAMTWFMDVIHVAPLALITAPEKRCGKTQLLTILSYLCARAVAVSSISPAALYRTIEAWNPALMIDEADAFMRENEELRGIINSGHTRNTAFVIRTTGESFTPTRFSTWGAKAIAGIGHLADTLMDRSIILELRRKLPTEQVERLRYAEPTLFHDLRAKLARFAEDSREDVRLARPELPESLDDRQQDNWEPLLAIAQVAGGEWPGKALKAALVLSGTESIAQTIGTELLADIRTIFENRHADRISSADLITALCDDDEAPWCSYNRGKPISPRQIAKRLREYGITSSTVRFSGTTAKGYLLSDFAEAFSRYLPAALSVCVTASQQRNNSKLDGKISVTTGDRVTDKKQGNLLNLRQCCGVTDKTPLQGGESKKEGNVAEQFHEYDDGVVGITL